MRFCFILLVLFISSVALSQTPADVDGGIFTIVEEPPVFRDGGMSGFNKYIADNLKYPKKEKRKHIEGKVFISFVVRENGSISDVTCVKGITEALNQEGIRLIQNSPPWRPAKMNGKVVPRRFVIPVEFKLATKKKSKPN